MAQISIPGGGAGGAASDECTATTNYVFPDYTAVTKDSNDEAVAGTMPVPPRKSTVTLTAADGRKVVQQNASSDACWTVKNSDNVTRSLIKIPESGYYSNTDIIGVEQSKMASCGGLSAAKLLSGQSAFGISGTATSDGTVIAAEMASGKIAYSKGSKITGTLAAQGGSTTTPGTANKTIVTAPRRVTGNIIVAGASTLTAANIKKNVTIFGVKGTFEGYVPTATIPYNRGVFASGYSVAGSVQPRGTGSERSTISYLSTSMRITGRSGAYYYFAAKPMAGINTINMSFIGTTEGAYLGININMDNNYSSQFDASKATALVSGVSSSTTEKTISLNVSAITNNQYIFFGPGYVGTATLYLDITKIWYT